MVIWLVFAVRIIIARSLTSHRSFPRFCLLSSTFALRIITICQSTTISQICNEVCRVSVLRSCQTLNIWRNVLIVVFAPFWVRVLIPFVVQGRSYRLFWKFFGKRWRFKVLQLINLLCYGFWHERAAFYSTSSPYWRSLFHFCQTALLFRLLWFLLKLLRIYFLQGSRMTTVQIKYLTWRDVNSESRILLLQLHLLLHCTYFDILYFYIFWIVISNDIQIFKIFIK